MSIFQTFQKPLLESELLTEKEVAMIFVNWKELIMCNIKLLKYDFSDASAWANKPHILNPLWFTKSGFQKSLGIYLFPMYMTCGNDLLSHQRQEQVGDSRRGTEPRPYVIVWIC